MKKISRSNIAAVIFDEAGRVLLCKRSQKKKIAPGRWRFPGGQIEKGETRQEALCRELKEELSVTTLEIYETDISHTYQIGDETHRTHYAHARIEGELTLNHENEEYAYVPLDELEAYIESPHLPLHRQVIEWELSS